MPKYLLYSSSLLMSHMSSFICLEEKSSRNWFLNAKSHSLQYLLLFEIKLEMGERKVNYLIFTLYSIVETQKELNRHSHNCYSQEMKFGWRSQGKILLLTGIWKNSHLSTWSASIRRCQRSRSLLHHSLRGYLWKNWHENPNLWCSATRGQLKRFCILASIVN